MEELLLIGLNENEIKELLEINPEIADLRSSEITNLINILALIDCDNETIKNILQTNPMYLSRNYHDVHDLIYKLKQLGLESLDITFDSNPWLLNYDVFEIDQFIIDKQTTGLSQEEIIDLLDQGRLD